ncbi:MAG: hypothetical protein KatS3mg114_0536 [Planctomycetaceae bacterium]|nr:MAG: hypothetical protein KatS3mg114_0536 [Planctomycetaceae bacterium]
MSLQEWNMATDRTQVATLESLQHTTDDGDFTTRPEVTISRAISAGDNTPTSEPDFPDLGERYQVEQRLGQGGMGSVYLAWDKQEQRHVAIKVVNNSCGCDPHLEERLTKEARLLARLESPYIVRLFDVLSSPTGPQLVMEFVRGTDLKDVINTLGRLPEPLALWIMLQVADGLTVAHRHGIVHRDLKPANILLVAALSDEDVREQVLQTLQQGIAPQIKICDFGLARQIEQTESLALTRTGVFMGTPHYLAPEQCRPRMRITPACDIYALGITLFEALAGRPPFCAEDPLQVITQHCFQPPPDVRQFNPLISEATANLLERMLAKEPSQRPIDAEHLADLLRQHLREQVPSQSRLLVPSVPRHVTECTWEWQLQSSPSELWPYISDTHRINAAVGLPDVKYRTMTGSWNQPIIEGELRLWGFTARYRKAPVEWIEGQSVTIKREYLNGPWEWYLSQVELEPTPGGGTRVRQTLRTACRSPWLTWLSRWLMQISRRGYDRVYRRLDQILCDQMNYPVSEDPYLANIKPSRRAVKFAQRMREHWQHRGAPLAYAESFLDYLLRSSPLDLAKIRPRWLAVRLKMPLEILLDLCLDACQFGALEPRWDFICPICRSVAQQADSLQHVQAQTRCAACQRDFNINPQENIELVFRSRADFRAPDLRTYCLGGPREAPHVIAQLKLEPMQQRELTLPLHAGEYLIRKRGEAEAIRLEILPNHVGHRTLRVTLPAQPSPAQTLIASAGIVRLLLHNPQIQPVTVRLERTTLPLEMLTAAEALQHPHFARCFPLEEQAYHRLVPIITATIVGFRITNILDLILSGVDVGLDSSLQQSLVKIREAMEQHGGRVVRQTSDAVLSAFPSPEQALTAIQAILGIATTEAQAQGWNWRLALHRAQLPTLLREQPCEATHRCLMTMQQMLELPLDGSCLASEAFATHMTTRQLLQTLSWVLEPVPQAASLGLWHVRFPQTLSSSANSGDFHI